MGGCLAERPDTAGLEGRVLGLLLIAGLVVSVTMPNSASAQNIACPDDGGSFLVEERGFTIATNPCTLRDYFLDLDQGASAIFIGEYDEPGTLAIGGTVNLAGTTNIRIEGAVPATFNVPASVVIQSGGTLNNVTGVIDVGLFAVADPIGIQSWGYGAALVVREGGRLDNRASIAVEGDYFDNSFLSNSGTLWNSGNIRIGGTTFSPIVQIENFTRGALNNAGLLINEFGGSITLNPEASMNNEDFAKISNDIGAVLVNHGAINNEGIILNDGELTNSDHFIFGVGDGARLTNQAGASLQNGDSGYLLNSNRGLLTNRGTLANAGTVDNIGAILNNEASGTIINTGELTNASSGEFNNAGTLINEAGGLLNNNAGMVNNGTLTNESGAELANNVGGVLQNSNVLTNHGTLSNSGKLISAVINNSFKLLNTASGELSIVTSLLNEGQLFSDGLLITGAGSTLINNRSMRNGGVANFTNHGTFRNNSSLGSDAGASITSTGLIENAGLISSAGALTNTGRFENYAGAQLINTVGATLDNNNELLNLAGALITNDGTLRNNSSLANVAGATITNTGTLENRGILSNRGELNNSGLLRNISRTFSNFGQLTNDDQLRTGELFENRVGGTLTNNALLRVDFELFNFGDLVNNETMQQVGLLRNKGAGTLLNNGDLLNTTGAWLTNDASAILTNNGSVDNESVLINDGNLDNRVGATLINGDRFSIARIENNGVISNAGDITSAFTSSIKGTGTFNQSAGSLTVDGTMQQDDINIIGGAVFGSGSIESDQGVFVGSGASLDPGNSVGHLEIIGDLQLEGTLNIEIESLLGFDTLDITGTLDLMSGTDTLTLDWLDGYVAMLDDSFDLITANTIIGEFDLFNFALGLPQGFQVELEYQLSAFGDDILTARISAVPLPGGFLLFGSALISVIALRRRKVNKVGGARTF